MNKLPYLVAFLVFVGIAELGMTMRRERPPTPPRVVVPTLQEGPDWNAFKDLALAMHGKMYQMREAECAKRKSKTGECAPVPVPLDD